MRRARQKEMALERVSHHPTPLIRRPRPPRLRREDIAHLALHAPQERPDAKLLHHLPALVHHVDKPPRQPLRRLEPRENSNLHQARLAAQARLEAAQRLPRWFVNVVDERGLVVEKFAVGAFLGSVESRVRYVLSADGGATDEGGGVVTVEDMVRDDGGEMVGLLAEEGAKKGRKGSDVEGAVKGRKEGCCGRWNTYSGVVVDKKDRERWWHQERGRWRAVVLS